MRPFTIIRTHLELFGSSDQAAASESFAFAVGLAVVSEQAAAIGVTAVPTPITDMESDMFFLHKVVMGDFVFASGSGFQDTPIGSGISIDSKAMRKVNNDQNVVLVLEGAIAGFGEGCIGVVGGRMLVKLH